MDLSYLYMAGGITLLPGIRFQCRTATHFPQVCLKCWQDLNHPTKEFLIQKQRDIELFPSSDFSIALLDKVMLSTICYNTSLKVFWRQSGKREQT